MSSTLLQYWYSSLPSWKKMKPGALVSSESVVRVDCSDRFAFRRLTGCDGSRGFTVEFTPRKHSGRTGLFVGGSSRTCGRRRKNRGPDGRGLFRYGRGGSMVECLCPP